MKKSFFRIGMALLLMLWISGGCRIAGAADASMEREVSGASDAGTEDVIDPGQTVDFTIDLEDASRFLGISVYLVGEYDGEHFVYNEAVRDAVTKEYYLLSRAADKYAAARSIETYIKENKSLAPVAEVSVQNGVGTAKRLPVGLYLFVQNESDFNGQLTTAFLVEAPSYSTKTEEYLYDIRLFPKWERTVWFSFRPEVIYPLGIVLILLGCVLLALFGAKMIRALILLAMFGAFGYLGLRLAMRITGEFLWYMIFFVSFAFLGVGLLYGLYALTLQRVISGRVKRAVHRQMYWFTPILACAIACFTVKTRISEDMLFWLIIPAGVAFVGFVIQFIGRKDIRNFFTYEDLLLMERPDERES